MATIVKGSSDYQLAKQRQRWTKERGWLVERRYLGPRSGADTQIATLQAAGAVDLSVDRDGEPCEIVALFNDVAVAGTTPDQDPDSTAVWELIANPNPKDLRSFKVWNQSGSNAEAIEKIDQAIRDGSAYSTDWGSAYPGFGYETYKKLRLLGVDSYLRVAFVLRKTYSTTSISSVRAAQLNALKVMSYSQALGAASVRWEAPSIREWDGTAWAQISIDQWLKMYPVMRYDQASKKTEITIEWLGDEKWSGTLYDGGLADP